MPILDITGSINDIKFILRFKKAPVQHCLNDINIRHLKCILRYEIDYKD